MRPDFFLCVADPGGQVFLLRKAEGEDAKREPLGEAELIDMFHWAFEGEVDSFRSGKLAVNPELVRFASAEIRFEVQSCADSTPITVLGVCTASKESAVRRFCHRLGYKIV
jgi:hypothetical protein